MALLRFGVLKSVSFGGFILELLARLANLPGALPGACAQGLIWGIMAIGVYLTYRILDVADLTVDSPSAPAARSASCVCSPA